MAEPTPNYGITDRTRKPVEIACAELSQAINAMSSHHAEELEALKKAAAALAADSAATSTKFLDDRPISDHLARLEGIASDLRLARYSLLQHLEPLRDPVLDALEEAHSLLPEKALKVNDVRPRPLPPAPKPILGLELSPVERLKILLDTLEWSQGMSRHIAVQALGPCYLLSKVIEHPAPEAMAFRASLDEARDGLKVFMQRDRFKGQP